MVELIITSSILILVVLLLRFLLRGRISRRVQYALWLVVALRLLVPISAPAPTSVLNVVDARRPEEFLTQQVIRIGPDVETPQLPAQTQETQEVPAGRQISLKQAAIVVWAAGAAVTGVVLAGVNISFYVRLKKRRRKYRVFEYRLPIYVAEGLPSPCLFGLFRPAVYLTPKAVQEKEALSHILTHEYCHYCQKDHIWSLVRCLCLAAYWFNPLVWAAAFCSRTDCELACDELAVKYLGEGQKAAYGRTLVNMVQKKQSVSLLACTATTMALGKNTMKQRVLMIVKSPKTSVGMAVAIGLCLCVLVSCTFTGKAMTAQEAVDTVTVSYEEDEVSFTLPEEYKNGKDWNILVYGTANMGDGSRSVHLFEEENTSHGWEPGETYTISLAQAQYTQLQMEIYMYSDETLARTIDLLEFAQVPAAGYNTVYITFPAYQEGRTQYNGSIFDTPAFDAKMLLPVDWKVSFPEKGERASGGPLWTAVNIHDQDGLLATIGFNRYEKYEEEVEPENYYKTVYPELRLSRIMAWENYTPVRTSETMESALATVFYIEPDLPENKNLSWAQLPEKEVPGILCYNDELQVYVAIKFAEGREIGEETLRIIAKSLEVLPSEYGLSGRRFTSEYYSNRDYSAIQVKDAQGNDVSKILIDLWYCASDAYDVDGNVVFENGQWVSLQENLPEFVELKDYDQVIHKIFTPNAIAQFESSDVVLIQKTQDGAVYRLAPWRTGYSYAYAMTDIQAKEVSENKITAVVTYEKNAGYAGAWEDPAYVPQYDTVEFTVVCQDGIWLVDSYTYPETKN